MRTLSFEQAGERAFPDVTFAVVDGLESVRQRVVERLRFWSGTWFMQSNAGVPYRDTVLGNVRDHGLAARTISNAIRSVDDVTGVRDVRFVVEPSTRQAEYSATVETVYGDMAVTFEAGPDFDAGR